MTSMSGSRSWDPLSSTHSSTLGCSVPMTDDSFGSPFDLDGFEIGSSLSFHVDCLPADVPAELRVRIPVLVLLFGAFVDNFSRGIRVLVQLLLLL